MTREGMETRAEPYHFNPEIFSIVLFMRMATSPAALPVAEDIHTHSGKTRKGKESGC